MGLDNLIFSRIAGLAECLCQTIQDEGLPGLCFCGVLPGAEAPFDYVGECDDCGMAWVRMSNAYASNVLGQANLSENHCDMAVGFEVEVGIIRCLPTIDGDGEIPTREEMLATSQLVIADMLAMRKAITCCPNLGETIMGEYQPYGPEGGVVGGWFTVALQDV
jgi:hypothetical protein